MKQIWVFIVASLLISCGAAVTLGPGVRFKSPLNNVTYSINSTLTVHNYVNFTEGILDLGTKTIDAGGPYSKVLNINPPFNSMTRSFIAVNYTRRIGTPPPNYTVVYGGLTPDRPLTFRYVCPNGAVTTLEAGLSNTTYTFQVHMSNCESGDPRFDLILQGDSCITDEYTSSIEYNITAFKGEATNTHFIFNGTNFLDIICPNNGTDRVDLTGKQDHHHYYTREQPIFSLKLDGGERIRELTMTENTDTFTYYVPEETVPQITFRLRDYSGQYRNSILYVRRTINGTLEVMNSRQWGTENEVITNLYNHTPYHVYLLNRGQPTSIRDYGYISILPTDTTKYIDVTSINLGNANRDKFVGGLTISTLGDSNTNSVSVHYNKTEGLLNYIQVRFYIINGSVYNPTLIYSSPRYNNTQDGIISYVVPNASANYMAEISFNNEGHEVSPSIWRHIYIQNFSSRLADLNLPGEFAGVTATRLYMLFAIGTLVIAGIGFTQLDNDYGAVIISVLGMIFYGLGWTVGMQNAGYVFTLALLISVFVLLAKRRYA